MVSLQNVAHGDLVEVIAEVRESPLDATIPPCGILFGHTHDQLLHFLGDPRPAQRSALRAAVELLRDEAVIPAQECVGRHQRRHRFEALTAKRMGERRKAAAFGVCKTEPSVTELSFEDTVFLLAVGDDLGLVPLQPAGHHGDGHVQDQRLFSGWKQRSQESVQYTPKLRNFNG